MTALSGHRILLCVTGGIAAYKSAELVRRLREAGAAVRVAMTDNATRFVGASAVVVAPASANTLARLAHGFADDLVSTLCLATEAPIAVAPAMNRVMWAHAATQANVATLRGRGVLVIGPASGDQACGETGEGRMAEPADIVRLLAGDAA